MTAGLARSSSSGHALVTRAEFTAGMDSFRSPARRTLLKGAAAASLAAAVPAFERVHLLGALLAAMACGLQNAMVTTYSGALVRTTHLSGMFTDLGIGLGHLLRGLPLPVRRLSLSALIIGGFTCLYLRQPTDRGYDPDQGARV